MKTIGSATGINGLAAGIAEARGVGIVVPTEGAFHRRDLPMPEVSLSMRIKSDPAIRGKSVEPAVTR
jgi:hypothetical protein